MPELTVVQAGIDLPRRMIGEKLLATIKKPCQRILIINPQTIPREDFVLDQILNKRCWIYPPYGPGVLCRTLEQRGYTTEIIDLNLEIVLAARQEREKFCYDVWIDKLQTKLDQFRPDLVGISCMFTMTHVIVKQIVDRVKTTDPHLPIIAGGVHITNAGKLVLEDCPKIDFIGTFECDTSFPDLIDFVNSKIPLEKIAQMATLIDGQYISLENRATPNAQEIDAFPIYHHLPISQYDQLGQIGTYGFMRTDRPAASVLSNRGCRAHCSFCSVASFNGPGVRMRSIKSVANEIELLVQKYGIKHITWLDDDLLFNKQRTLDLFQEITNRKLDITWDASNGLIAAAITPENMKAMVESGCIGFNLGIESGNPEILHSVHKPGTVDTFRKAKVIIDQYPEVFVKGFLIIGFPNETLNQMLDTMNLSLELALDWYSIQLLNPLPSTEIYEKMIEQGLIQDNLSTSNVAFVFGPHGRQKLQEDREKLNARDFFNLFNVCLPDEVPNPADLGDYWFLMDYKLNYEIVLVFQDRIKLNKKRLQLLDIANRIAPKNPIAHLFLGIIQQKFGYDEEALQCASKTEKIVEESDYWQKRFVALELYDLLEKLKLSAFPRLP